MVGSAVAPQFADERGVKFIPERVSVKAGPPALTELGVRLRRAGAAADAGVTQAKARDTGKTTIKE